MLAACDKYHRKKSDATSRQKWMTVFIINNIYQFCYQKLSTHMLSSTTNKLQVWLDCDPGLDDIMAIILTAWDERISLIGVSTSPGNSSLGNTSRNACDVLHSIGRGDVEVVMGSPKPFCSSGIYSDNIHGENGIGGLELPPAPRKPISEDRFSEIYKRIMRVTGKVCFINTGSLTNLAILLASHPDLKEKLE
jgi:inosine-uridine nucleoside N-ribohydrolase